MCAHAYTDFQKHIYTHIYTRIHTYIHAKNTFIRIRIRTHNYIHTCDTDTTCIYLFGKREKQQGP
jgi:hypothetical protein